MQPEARLTKKIIEALIAEGALAVKIHGGTYQSRGLPDIVCCYKGIFIGLEVKVPGKEKTVSDLQRKKLWEIHAAGGVGRMVTSIHQAFETLEEVDRGKRRKPNVEPYEG